MQQYNKPMFILEGNIGSGKSTLLKILQQNVPNLMVLPEPTNKWQHVGSDDNNILNLFYKDTKRWGYTFQTYAFISRVQSILELQEKQSPYVPAILERSVYCDRFCFAKNCFEAGLMTDLEWQIYKEWFSWLVESHVAKPTGFIYLKTKPEVCHQRSKNRGRQEEKEIKISYLEALHNKHEAWLIHKEETLSTIEHTPILVLDCNNDFENNREQQQEHITAIKHFIEKNTNSYINPTGKDCAQAAY